MSKGSDVPSLMSLPIELRRQIWCTVIRSPTITTTRRGLLNSKEYQLDLSELHPDRSLGPHYRRPLTITSIAILLLNRQANTEVREILSTMKDRGTIDYACEIVFRESVDTLARYSTWTLVPMLTTDINVLYVSVYLYADDKFDATGRDVNYDYETALGTVLVFIQLLINFLAGALDSRVKPDCQKHVRKLVVDLLSPVETEEDGVAPLSTDCLVVCGGRNVFDKEATADVVMEVVETARALVATGDGGRFDVSEMAFAIDGTVMRIGKPDKSGDWLGKEDPHCVVS